LNEEEIAEVKLEIEVWERDIYQKKRVEMDVHVDILNTHGHIDQVQDDINERNKHIAQLQKELEDATAELEDFKDDCGERDEKIAEL
jgi:chromosome segregation ATPase